MNDTYLIEYLNTDGSVQSAHIVDVADLSVFPRVLIRRTAVNKLGN